MQNDAPSPAPLSPEAIDETGTPLTGAAFAPSPALIERLAMEARAALPEPWRAHALQVALRIEDFAPEDMLDSLDIHDPFELTGIYEGTPLTERSVMDQPLQPDTIWLFRRAILDEWADRGNVSLSELIGHIMIHELAHHFGWSDEDIAKIDPWWE